MDPIDHLMDTLDGPLTVTFWLVVGVAATWFFALPLLGALLGQ